MYPGHLPIIFWANAVHPFPHFQALFFKEIQMNYKGITNSGVKREQIVSENMSALGNIHNLDL